jgi:heat shock protein HtpX
MKRILLFVMTNLAVVVVLGVVASLLGVNRYLTANGLNLGALLGFAPSFRCSSASPWPSGARAFA